VRLGSSTFYGYHTIEPDGIINPARKKLRPVLAVEHRQGLAVEEQRIG
jgi:hypothetical protein